MTPELWRQIEELYEAALDLPPAERNVLLHRADGQLRARVEAMLAQDGSELDHLALEAKSWLLHTETAAWSGTELGPYKIEQRIGAGGMGQVYRALDMRLGRTVAIKLLSPEFAAEPEFKRRFLWEARAASALNHHNIVVLYDISSHNGVDFLVMEHVAGRTLKT
jgi:eukaryotic-like serine/threonine-protein kinase